MTFLFEITIGIGVVIHKGSLIYKNTPGWRRWKGSMYL